MILPILLFLMVPFVRAQTKTITFSNSGNNYIVYGDYKSKSTDYNPDITICSGTYKFTNGAGNNHPLKISGLPDNTYTVITTQYKNIMLTPLQSAHVELSPSHWPHSSSTAFPCGVPVQSAHDELSPPQTPQ